MMRAPAVMEPPKRAMLIRGGAKLPRTITQSLRDLRALKAPHSVLLEKKTNAFTVNVLDEAQLSKVEFLCGKNKAAFGVVGTASKKRGQSLTFVRTFDGRTLDAYALRVIGAVPSKDIPTPKFRPGAAPLVLFQGAWETGSPLMNMFLDFFGSSNAAGVAWVARGSADSVRELDLAALSHVIALTAIAPTESAPLKVFMRVYTMHRGSGSASSSAPDAQADGSWHAAPVCGAPAVQLRECGPRLDFEVAQTRPPTAAMWRAATRRVSPFALKPKPAPGTTPAPTNAALARVKAKARSRTSRDGLGNVRGRIHTGRQDFSSLRSTRSKALRASTMRRSKANAPESL